MSEQWIMVKSEKCVCECRWNSILKFYTDTKIEYVLPVSVVLFVMWSAHSFKLIVLQPSSLFHINSFKCHSLTSPNIIFISATIIIVHKCIPEPNAFIESMFQALANHATCDTHGQHHNQAKIATNSPARIVLFGRNFVCARQWADYWLHKNKNKHFGCSTDHKLNAEHCWNRRWEFLQQIFQLKRKKGWDDENYK